MSNYIQQETVCVPELYYLPTETQKVHFRKLANKKKLRRCVMNANQFKKNKNGGV